METHFDRAHDPLVSLYREELGFPALLTKQEERNLAQCIERGQAAAVSPNQPGHRELIEAGKRARNCLIEANLRLVIHIARRYQGFGLDLIDLIQEGNLGLIHAIEKYDYRKGYKLSTYAIWWIRQFISRAVVEKSWMIHIPLYKVDEMKRLMKMCWLQEQVNGQEPLLEVEDLAKQMGRSAEAVRELFQMAQVQKMLSLDTKQRIGESEIPLGDLLEDQGYSPEEIVLRQGAKEQIHHLLSLLGPREREVICLSYGIGEDRAYNLVEVAKKVHLSHEAVRQMEMRALQKLIRLAHATELAVS